MDLDCRIMRKVRKYLDLSQLEMAEKLEVSLVTYQRWENGKAKPQPCHRRRFREVFHEALHALGMCKSTSDQQNASTQQEQIPSVVEHFSSQKGIIENREAEEVDESQLFLQTNMTAHLFCLAFKDHTTLNHQRDAIRQAIEGFDAMNSNTNKNYQVTRREALCSLATLPMITLGLQSSSLPSTQYGTMLAHCTASIEACWELGKSKQTDDLALAFQCISRYLPILKDIVKQSPTYRQEAATLAARAALLKTKLGWHLQGPKEAVHYAKDAIIYGKESNDILLLISAYNKLVWVYFYENKPWLALHIMDQEMKEFTQHAHRMEFPACMECGIYTTLAIVQARNGMPNDEALGKAMDIDPGADSYTYLSCTPANVAMEIGLAYYYQGNQTKALQWLSKAVDPQTLMLRGTSSEGLRIETLNTMTFASLKAKKRDMDTVIHYWTAATEGIQVLQSEQRFNEACTAYEMMQAVWPDEARIKELKRYLVHW